MKTSNNEIKIISPGMERRKLTNKIHLLDENKFIALSKKIDSSFNVVQEKYKELNKVASPVVENEYLWGLIKTTDVEKSLDGLLKVIQELAKCTLGAFQANSENLEAILELMKISVSIENDLYRQLEDSDCSKENIANLLHDLCSQYNIDSHAIEVLFEQSFNRTINLRTRINNLREEFFERISKNEEKFDHFDETIQKKEEEFTSCFDSKTAEYKKQLEISIKECLSVIDKYQKELNATKNSYKQEIETLKYFLMESIKQHNVEVSKQHDTKFKQYERENTVLKNQMYMLTHDVSKLQNRSTWTLSISIIATIVAAISFAV